jgi:pyrimidine deaminase RibD-like protein
MNFHDLDNYNLADAVKFHQHLNPRLWGNDEHLLPDVRDKLLAIASDFQEFLGVDELNIQDITISGSNAAYSYTTHSDIDLHLVVDIPDDPVYQELFAAKKYQYNAEHNIKIAGVPVELYVQPSDQKHVSQGIYSVKNGDWTQVPQRRRATIDDSCVQHKTADLDARIHSAIRSGDADAVNQLWEKIRTMRQTGLEKNGEFGCENIAFKLLRNSGCLTKLKKAKTAIQDRELSLARKSAPRKKMNYGMRDYWYPGTAYAGQDHPAGTEAEQVDESADPDQLKKILHRFYASCVDKLQLENPPQLRLETTPDWSQENGSFGQYESETNTLILATSGRHVLDILRTMAHEMTHRQQDEQNPLPIDAGETGSPWEDQANAMAGRIMRDWAQEQPEMFDGVTLEEASGYIPTKAQAKDPRFVMALTKDVQPGAVGKEANKLGLETDSQGHPALLTAGLNKLLREFKEQDLFEINMGGKNLRKEAAKTGALAGMEFEMIVPNTSSEDQELEPDFDSDERASSPSDIRDFFYDGDYNSRRNTQDMVDQIMDDYGNWQVEQFDSRWDGDAEEFIFQYIKDNMDDNEIIELLDLEPDHDVTRQDYLVVADMIATEQMEPWYEDAKNDASDSFYEDDRFEDFLQDNNIEHMSDIYHRYDSMIHWPHYTGGGGGSTSVEDVADSFSRAVGRPAQARSDYHAYGQERPGPGKNFYVVEPDGSLEPDDTNDSGLEFVSPPLPIDDIMSDLKKVKKWADQTGCYTNDSTGLHINISVPNYSQDQLDYVKLALLMGDEYVLNNFGRAGNTYAKSAMGKIRGKVTPENAKQILDKMKSGLDQLATKAIHSGYTDKYTSINTKDGHIEFRSPGGDWLDDNFDKIENTLMRFTVAMSAALNPEAYRQEYLKKLYKMLSPKGENDPLAIFAKYSAGQLPKAALKSFVRQAQLERGNKAAKQAELDTMQKELTPAPEESTQGNWGVWVPALDRFATQYGNSETRRFMRHGDAQAWIQDYNTRNAGNDLELVVREIEPATAQTASPESGNVQWNIVDADGNVVHTFRNTNAQADANQAGRSWIWSQRLSHHAGRGPWDIVPAANSTASSEPIPGSTLDLQRQRQRDAALAAASMAADAEHAANRRAPTPIPGVQDIEIDIPMAQTQWEVYDRSTNQPVFTMYAETQANAWRKGQEWVATAMQTDPTIDASNFSVRQSAQPVVESREITKLGKLDSVLEQCINMIHRGQETNPKKYGRVAACLIDNKNNHTYAINLPGPNGTRRHAERVAIDTHLKRHGRIGSNAIMVTTLSPCVNHMDERAGESCTELLSDYGIEKCYAGWQDPTQQPAEDYPFNLQVTDNADIFNTCQHIAASFLPQVMANNLNEVVNPDCFDPAFNDTQIFDGLTYRATVEEEYGKPVLTIKVLDDNFQQVGISKFKQSKNAKGEPAVVSLITSFRPEYQGQGIARNIYAYVRMLGNTIVPSKNQLPPGKAMWNAWKKSGDAKHLMRDVAEEEEPTRIKLGNNNAAGTPNESN